MENINSSENKCSGCSACYSACPVNAICIKENDKGFFEPVIDENKCIHCGKCLKVCKKFNEDVQWNNKFEKKEVLSAQTKDVDTLKTVTSGGIGYEIAAYGIKNKFKVIGTIYDKKKEKAKAIIAEDMESIEKIKGSKYLQSDVAEAYKLAIDDLKNNNESKYIVFGTPCQVAGLAKLLKLYDIKNTVVLVELFCHGVPSYIVWRKYLEYIKNKHGEIENVKFRDKAYSWHKYYMNISLKNNKNVIEKTDDNDFYKAFLDNVLLNDSCQDCVYRRGESFADIRIGDFWGKTYSGREDGVSAIIPITESGKEIISRLSSDEKIDVLDRFNASVCLGAQSTDTYKNQNIRDEAFENLKTDKRLKKIISQYRRKFPLKRRIKILIKKVCKLLPKCIKDKLKYAIKK